jgi:hypothetical protein
MGLTIMPTQLPMEWFSQGAFIRPTAQQSPFYSARTKSEQSFPFAHRMSLSVVGNHAIGTSVVRLDGERCPSTVAGLIIAGVVDAVQRVALWARSHVGQESREVRAPFIADGDSSVPVVLIGPLASVVAPRFHGSPRNVFARAIQAVRQLTFSGRFIVEASAAPCVPISKRTADHCSLSSACAMAFPRGASSEAWLWRGLTQHRQSAEHLASHVNSPHVGLIIRPNVHNVPLLVGHTWA